jgi:serine/threonine-protein kinase
MAALAQDTVLGERYRLTGRIAIGGMGEVWRAEDTLLHRPVAVKVLKHELSMDPAFLERFRNEARSAAAFSHAGIANVFDYGETEVDGNSPDDGATAYLVMELVEGEPLSAILAREVRIGVARTLDYVGQAAAALQVAHRTGMVHRDIKPGNLLIAADGQLKITDFGIARAASTIRHTQAGMVVGTAQYFSPEQAEGRVVGPASDVYSLGVVAYECLAGQLPFTADSPVTVAVMQIRNVPPPLPPDVPPPVRAMVERAMAKDPRWRYQNGGELAAAVADASAGRMPPAVAVVPVSAPMLPPPPPAPPKSAGKRIAITLGILVVLAALGVIIWLVVRHNDGNDGAAQPDNQPTGQQVGPSSPPPADQPSAPTSAADGQQVELNPRRYVGHTVTDVIASLREHGLRPALASTTRNESEGTVKALMAPPGHVLQAPTTIAVGSQVTIVTARSTGQHLLAGVAGGQSGVPGPQTDEKLEEQQAHR